MLNLRDYQIESIAQLSDGFKSNHNRQLLYLPTGSGKTEVAIEMMRRASERGHRCVMIMDRRVLVDQTSKRMRKYSIPHGVLMADYGLWRPWEKIQICTYQTIEARDGYELGFADVRLLIIDEAHIMRNGVIEFMNANPQVRVIALSASPFTKGMGRIYPNVVSCVSPSRLTKEGHIVNIKAFRAREIDMKGAKRNSYGDWNDKDLNERGIKITGDIITEYQNKLDEFFDGKPRKTIVFSAGVAHGLDLAKAFDKAGYNFYPMSYRQKEEDNKAALEEFGKPDSEIQGLISTDMLTKGFDQPDVEIGISARPYPNSFNGHIQQLGRVGRPDVGKKQAIWLCHSGNYMLYLSEYEDVFFNGVTTLDDSRGDRAARELTEREKEEATCPRCKAIWVGKTDTCSHCGYVKVRRNAVTAVPGEMVEVGAGRAKKKSKYSDDPAAMQENYAMLLGYCREKGWKDGTAHYAFQDMYKGARTPNGVEPIEPNEQMTKFMVHRRIKNAKRKR